MTIALEVRGLVKRHSVGAGGCLASADVLRGVDLVAHAGEALVIVGQSGSGKSTLLLCLAGLLSPDRGDIRWFGESSRAFGVRRVLYHVAPTDLLRGGAAGEVNIHLLDMACSSGASVDRWIANRCEAGDVVVVAAREDDVLRDYEARVLRLKYGRLLDVEPRSTTRVAEALYQ